MSTPAVYRFLPFTRRGLVAELRDSRVHHLLGQLSTGYLSMRPFGEQVIACFRRAEPVNRTRQWFLSLR